MAWKKIQCPEKGCKFERDVVDVTDPSAAKAIFDEALGPHRAAVHGTHEDTWPHKTKAATAGK